MILVDSLLYKIDQKLNKLSSNAHQQIPLEDKILALNEAQILLIKRKLTGATVNGLGFDASKKRYEDLQKLVVDFKENALPLTLVNKDLNQWSTGISKLKPSYLFYVDSYVIADKGVCKNRKIWVNKDLVKHGDIQFLLNNTHYKPSFEYQETFNTISADEISIYTDGTFIPSKLHLMYLRYPVYINKVGYVDFENVASVNQDCELPDYMEDELLDLAVQSLAMYTENAAAMQSAEFRIQKNE